MNLKIMVWMIQKKIFEKLLFGIYNSHPEDDLKYFLPDIILDNLVETGWLVIHFFHPFICIFLSVFFIQHICPIKIHTLLKDRSIDR